MREDMACVRMKLLCARQSASVSTRSRLSENTAPQGKRGNAREDPRVGRQSRNRNTDVVIDANQLLLITGQLARGALFPPTCQPKSRAGGRGKRTLRPRRTTWVSDRRPTQAEPCLTASRAYSTCMSGLTRQLAVRREEEVEGGRTWCSRPCGEKVELSLS